LFCLSLWWYGLFIFAIRYGTLIWCGRIYCGLCGGLIWSIYLAGLSTGLVVRYGGLVCLVRLVYLTWFVVFVACGWWSLWSLWSWWFVAGLILSALLVYVAGPLAVFWRVNLIPYPLRGILILLKTVPSPLRGRFI